jgi:O-antigen/teichoic acid export membrane protein
MTRIYSPVDYGGYALYSSMGMIVGVAATGQYHSAIMLPRNDDDAGDVLTLSLALTVGVAGVALLLVIAVGPWLARIFGSPELALWLYFLPVGTLATGTLESISAWTARSRSYSRLARGRVVQQLTASSISVAMGMAGARTQGIIVSAFVGQALATAFLLWDGRAAMTVLRRTVDAGRMAAVASRYRAFPLYSAPQSLLDNVSTAGIAFVFGRSFPLNALGQYSLGNRVIQAPAGLVGGAISTVFYQEAAARHAKGQPIWPLANKVAMRSALIFIPTLTVLALLAPMIFRLAFGERWEAAAGIIRALTPWIIVNTLTSPLSTLPQILGRQRTFLFIGVGYNVLQPATLALGAILMHDVTGAVWVMSCSASLYLAAVLLWFRAISRAQQ